MSIMYRFTFDESYGRTLIRRFYEQSPPLFRPPVQFTLLALPIVAGWLYVRSRPNLIVGWVDLAFVFVLAHLAAAPVFIRYLLLKRLKRSADFGAEAEVALSDDGLIAHTKHSQSKVAWAAYRRSARYLDGIMLIRPNEIRWLPDDALQDSSPQEATDLVQSKTDLRHVA